MSAGRISPRVLTVLPTSVFHTCTCMCVQNQKGKSDRTDRKETHMNDQTIKSSTLAGQGGDELLHEHGQDLAQGLGGVAHHLCIESKKEPETKTTSITR